MEGFVDLGKFTQEEDRTTPADHGMVMMFQPFQGEEALLSILCANTCLLIKALSLCQINEELQVGSLLDVTFIESA